MTEEATGGLGLPASIEAAWGRLEHSGRGPKRGLSLDGIVGAAIRVADTEGLAGVSMGRVATELGTSAMSLYRYLSAKDELVALMVDAALGPPPAGGDAPADWRAALSRWARAYHDALRRRPWILQVPLAGPPITPNATAWLEGGLGALGATRLSEPQKLSVMLLLSGFVRSAAALAADIGAHAGGEIMPSWGALLHRLTDAERFPALHAALRSEAFARDDDPDDEFFFGLERILDGVAVLVDSRRAR